MREYMAIKQSPARRLALKTAKSAMVLVGVGIGIALILASPLLLRYTMRDVDWARLSQISGTYAAASAIISGLGVGAVAVALLIQVGQAKAERIDAVRDIHRELIMTTLNDMDRYAPCWGPFATGFTASQTFFTVQILNYYWQGYDLGVFTEAELRSEVLPDLFAGQVGRDTWTNVRTAWKADTGSKGKKFYPIVEEEFIKACALDLLAPIYADDARKSQELAFGQAGPNRWLIEVTLGFAGGLFCAYVLRRSQRR